MPHLVNLSDQEILDIEILVSKQMAMLGRQDMEGLLPHDAAEKYIERLNNILEDISQSHDNKSAS